MMRNKDFLIVIIAALIGMLTLMLLPKKKDDKIHIKETIEITSPVIGSIEKTISTLGVVEPQNRIEIIPPVSGRIEEILVEEGDVVQKGDIVAWMSSTERAAILDAARARKDEDMESWEDVYKPTPLIAPINGTVIQRALEPGQTVTTSNAVLVISNRLVIEAWVDESDIGSVRIGQKAHITLDAYPDMVIDGNVVHIAHEAKTNNNVTIYEVDIVAEHMPESFRAGMSATIEIVVDERQNALLIPEEAVQYEDTNSYVFLKQAGKQQPQRHPVTLGISNDKQVEVTSGLTQEDKIVATTQSLDFKESKKSPLTAIIRKNSRNRR